MLRYVATLVFAVSAVALGDGISKVNGSIRVEDSQRTDDVPSVNGSITIGRGAQVREVDLYAAAGATIVPIRAVPPQRHSLPSVSPVFPACAQPCL